jgi:regulator of nonsense transcripts 1
MGKALEYDVSLLERLYTGREFTGMVKTMLDVRNGPALVGLAYDFQVQYRFPKELADFPSREFYEGRLRTGISNSNAALGILGHCSFPWPRNRDRTIIPTVFLQCSTEEDMGGMSKSNDGQVELIKRILPMLELTQPSDQNSPGKLSITILSPYTKQIQALRHGPTSSTPSFTVDSFQGRESDVVIFSSVRSNAEKDIGFVDDGRRLNVMWTRARLALIIIGDKGTLAENPLWRRALEACTEVALPELIA